MLHVANLFGADERGAGETGGDDGWRFLIERCTRDGEEQPAGEQVLARGDASLFEHAEFAERRLTRHAVLGVTMVPIQLFGFGFHLRRVVDDARRRWSVGV